MRQRIHDLRRERPDVIAVAGGDGTVALALALVAEAWRGLDRPEPALAILPLGAGNALAEALAIVRPRDKAVAAWLAALQLGQATRHEVPMVEVLGMRAPFAGVGFEADVRDDRAATSATVQRIPGLRVLLRGNALAALSLATRTAPRLFGQARPRVTIRVRGVASQLDRDGRIGAEIADGGTLWTGPCAMAACSTIETFGFGLRLFPFARTMPGRFQLRVADPGALEVLRRAPAARRGGYLGDSVRDFACTGVEISCDRPVAVEVAGDVVGRQEQFSIRMASAVAVAIPRAG